NRTLGSGAFAQARGQLNFPIIGAQVLSGFGRAYDSRSKLQIFKKGIDLSGGKNLPVFAVFGGKVAYSGTLPDYGTLVIIDHGDHFYTLSARLGAIAKKTGDSVTAGEVIGKIDSSGTPIYFEIRSRNVAVNPLQWLSN
ncbi:MAG: peptidoglycan DD-metalloendopeptidase family protein, partial [Bdellovibrionota bacterium]